jgi:hypothetical protein
MEFKKEAVLKSIVTNLMLSITIKWYNIQHIESTWIAISDDRGLLEKNKIKLYWKILKDKLNQPKYLTTKI